MITEMTVADPDSWMAEALCGGTEYPDLFCNWHYRHRAAHDFCEVCPVQQKCSDFADANRYVGMWGGVWRERSWTAGYVRIRISRGVAS